MEQPPENEDPLFTRPQVHLPNLGCSCEMSYTEKSSFQIFKNNGYPFLESNSYRDTEYKTRNAKRRGCEVGKVGSGWEGTGRPASGPLSPRGILEPSDNH